MDQTTTYGWAAGTLAAATGLAGAVAYAVAGKSSQVFGSSVYRGPGLRRSLALTFDDGPSEGSLELIHYLGTQNIPCTFFQCGLNVHRHPSIARAIRSAGHEIGNHTYSHARLSPRIGWHVNWRSSSYVENEIWRAQHTIEDELGVTPRLFRAPYGYRWFGVRAAQQRLGLIGVMWTVIGHDWYWPADRIVRHVLRKLAPGGIVCLHDGRDIQPAADIRQTLESVKKIVPVLKSEGYGFETVSDLLLQ